MDHAPHLPAGLGLGDADPAVALRAAAAHASEALGQLGRAGALRWESPAAHAFREQLADVVATVSAHAGDLTAAVGVSSRVQGAAAQDGMPPGRSLTAGRAW